ncbi:hypothetical protein SapgrDRAFT_3215 [Saprospira grandis DSM 2844]|uniref:J domain-containing protein n=1 Tax=Saprospira grandis DSM 2844 TaxID=694433 RepID=J1I7R6_9BACT|nr:hypothetical protein [Saprospira grandis]EJF54860.1 hypothetical protein SapgrDRAFT_3215 [Saprospira grandis DSM 2844]
MLHNPYDVLDLDQNASKKDIQKALPLALAKQRKEKKYSPKDIMQAQKELLDPAKRLAADFLFLDRIRAKRPRKFEQPELPKIKTLNQLAQNPFDPNHH